MRNDDTATSRNDRWPKLWERSDGSYRAEWRTYTVRYMLDDGRTIDVETSRDDSDLRGALLAVTGAERIAGSVFLPEQGKLA